MRYFRMKQDRNVSYSLQLKDFDRSKNSCLFEKEGYPDMKKTTVLFLRGEGDEAMVDFLQCPVMMISARLKKIFTAYEEELLLPQIVLLHQETKAQYQYYMLLMDELDAKSEATEYYPDKTEKKLVLDREKIGHHHIFLLKNTRIREPFVSLAAAESILRRQVTGILFEEVEVR